MRLTKTTPILRMFDEAKVKAVYVEFLAFEVDWEYRFMVIAAPVPLRGQRPMRSMHRVTSRRPHNTEMSGRT